MRRIHKSTFLFLTVVVASVFLAAGAASAAGARDTVADLNMTLLRAMKGGPRLGYEGRYKLLEPVVMRDFDLPFIARFSVGRYWRKLDEKERMLLVEKFTTLSVATYAARFKKFKGERFEIKGERPLRRGRVLVESVLYKSNGEQVRMDYILRRKDGRWRIINVIVDGVSDLSLKRAQYTSIIRKEGFRALMEKFDEKILDYSTGD